MYISKNSNQKSYLNTLDVMVVAFGAMIGWGWVATSGDWIEKAGIAGTIIGFLLGGTMIYFVWLAYAELTTAFPEGGGVKTFSKEAFGTVGGIYL